MKIVQAIETSGPGGAERVLIRLCVELSRRGHEVSALLLREGWLEQELRREGVAVSILPLAKPLDRRFLDGLVSHLGDRGVDLLHAHEITFAFYGRLASRRLGIAQVATAHGRRFSRGGKRRLAGSLLLRGGRSFRLVAVSTATARQLARDFFIPRDRISVVPNGVDLPPSTERERRTPGGPLRLVAVGNLYPVKNHGLAIRAVHRLRQDGIDAELDLLGRGEEEASLRRLVTSLGLENEVRILGFRSDVGAFLERAHVFVSSSHSEGMPLSFLEAMAGGLPIVSSRVGGVPELIVSGTQGLLFEPGDLDGMVSALSSLARDESRRIGMARAAADAARKDYSTKAMVDRYLALYETLCGGERLT